MLDWTLVHTVFLDMDGTLLDLHFDNHFWQDYLPLCYATKQGLSPAAGREALMALYRKAEGTLNWYCLDYWSEQLAMDIPLLKQEVDHLIAIHPHVVDFLQAVRRAGRRLVLVTNAHGRSLALKMERTQLAGYFDTLICAHDLGLPKEDPAFWQRLQSQEPFDPHHTLLVDDSLPVLRSAQRYGIAHLRGVRCPDSRRPPRVTEEFIAIESFLELIPATAMGAN